MRLPKNVSNKEKIDSILMTLVHNDDAIDYIKNNISQTENVLGYMPDDKETVERLNIEKYILFNLEYVESLYEDFLRKFGVNR